MRDSTTLPEPQPRRPSAIGLCLQTTAALLSVSLLFVAGAGETLAEWLSTIAIVLSLPWLVLASFGLLQLVTTGIRALELRTRTDIDGDGIIGEPERLEVAIHHHMPDGGYRQQILSVPGVSAEQLRLFAQKAVQGSALAVNAWVGKGRPFSRQEFDAMVSELERVGLVQDKGGNIGRVLTVAGKNVLSRIAEE